MRSRLMLAAVVAAVLSIALSGVAAATTVVGQHGNYIFIDDDSMTTTGAICRYADPNSVGTWNIYKLTARAPSVWWFDTNSSITTQHGPVGWRLYLLHKAPAASTWSLLKKSTIQKKTAYEDQLVPYGSATKAPFTNIALSITANNFPSTELFMARVKVYWFRSDGTVRGSATHDVQNYFWSANGSDAGVHANCVRRFFE